MAAKTDEYQRDVAEGLAALKEGAADLSGVLNGDSRYDYTTVPKDDSARTQALKKKLTAAGWKPATGGETRSGFDGFDLWRRPKEVSKAFWEARKRRMDEFERSRFGKVSRATLILD